MIKNLFNLQKGYNTTNNEEIKSLHKSILKSLINSPKWKRRLQGERSYRMSDIQFHIFISKNNNCREIIIFEDHSGNLLVSTISEEILLKYSVISVSPTHLVVYGAESITRWIGDVEITEYFNKISDMVETNKKEELDFLRKLEGALK